jgi:predicted protein tyrosine phosphatase
LWDHHKTPADQPMKPPSISLLTICGIEELPEHGPRAVTHVLSLLDPTWPELTSFGSYGPHRRTTLRFHDVIDPGPGLTLPTEAHVSEILSFGQTLAAETSAEAARHLLVHCHMGISRSTAAMVALLAQADPQADEDRLFARLREIRPQAWPNSLIIEFADNQLGRKGRLLAALRRHYGVQLNQRPEFATWMRRLARDRELDMAE